MSIQWRMKVWQPDGTARPTIDVDGAVAALDRIEVDGAGNCLEATWQADPNAVTLKARDIVQIQVSTDGGSSWTSIYKGFVTAAGNPRAHRLQRYRAVGLKQRFYERYPAIPKLGGGADDVATKVDEALTVMTVPEGVSYSSSNVPTLNFQLGWTFPRLASAGDLLDNLVDTVGQFIVPTGESYTYDGVTYQAGDTVPAAKWGVNAEGEFFFRRPQASAVSASESDDQTLVEWERVDGEEVYDEVVFIYLNVENSDIFVEDTSGDGAPPLGVPVHRVFGSGSYGAQRRVQPDLPLDYLVQADRNFTTSGDWTNPGNARDGNSSTKATDGGNMEVESQEGTRSGVLKVRAEAPGDVAATAAFTWRRASDDGFLSTNTVALLFDQRQTHYIPIEARSRDVYDAGSDVYIEMQIGFEGGTDVYTFEFLAPDVDTGGTTSQKAAEVYMRDPASDPARVALVGSLGDVSQTMNLTPDGESEIEVAVERVEYSITARDGLVTNYHVEQQYNADQLAQKVVLERLIRQASS